MTMKKLLAISLLMCYYVVTYGAATVPARLYNGCGTNITIKVQVSACHSGIFVNVPAGGFFDFVATDNNDCGTPLALCNGPYRILQGTGQPADGYTFANGYPLQSTGAWGGGTISICGAPYQTNFFTVSIRNNSSSSRHYQVLDGSGNPIPGAMGQTWMTLAPGASGTLQFATTLLGNQWQIEGWDGPSVTSAYGGGLFSIAPGDGATLIGYGSNGDGSFNTTVNNGGSTYPTAGGPPVYTGPPSVIYSNPASWGSNQPIQFATGSDLTNTLQTGFSAVYSALNNGFAGANANLATAAGIITNALAGLSGGTNNGTASTNDAGYFDQHGTNISYYPLQSSGTNATSAGTAGNTALGAAPGDADTIIGDLNAITPPADGSGGAGLSFAMGPPFNCTVSIDPDVVTGLPLCAWIKTILTVLMLGWFAVDMGKLYVQLSSTMASAQSGGLPNLTGEFNFVGAALVPVLAAVFIAVWVVALLAFFTYATSYIPSLASAFGSLSTLSSAAWAIICRTFPMNLMFSLLVARATAYFIVGKAIMVAAAASRFLIGA